MRWESVFKFLLATLFLGYSIVVIVNTLKRRFE